MAIHYSLTEESNYLMVHTWGFDESRAEVQAYGVALVEACAERGVTRLLCDERELEYRLGTLDTFEAAQFMAAFAPSVARAAIVPNARSDADARFWETVAVNRGLTVHIFREIEEARRWLLEL
jgi:hypothetical protein